MKNTILINNNNVYSEYVKALNVSNPRCINEIPFLPISFFKTHRILIDEIQKLFLSKISSLLDGKYKSIKQKGNGTFHYKRDLPNYMKKNWKAKISNILKKYN